MSNDLRQALEQLRAEIHGTTDDSLVSRLDEIIDLVDLTEGKPGHLVKIERLKLLARALEVLPSLIHLIKEFFR